MNCMECIHRDMHRGSSFVRWHLDMKRLGSIMSLKSSLRQCICPSLGLLARCLQDANGQTPLQLALESASADVVTLLRLAALNKDGADSRCNSADGWIGIHMNDFKSGSGIASTPMSDGKCTPRDLLH
eukprot:m.417709 g.417709  ORF g.417709 m.417709 type:complete len:128 (+) comp21288_c0_seq23:1112-1495(+)